ncbi:MAG TPA: aspartate aminotransferase family protein [Alphaproteobacteria bacterium]|nr:aspartate aminotransferase family protein [Alphaproteobacteria bacterium]
MPMHLPKQGSPWSEIKSALLDAKREDYSWRRGRVPLYVYYRDQELFQVASEAYTLFFAENALGRRAFPSLSRLEADVVGMALKLFQAGAEAGGSFTSGGTESIFQAVKTARDWARARRPDIDCPTIIVPRTAHPAFNKAGHFLGVTVIRVPVRDDYRADIAAMRAAVTPDTIMLVGSAPSYPHGVFDPLKELSRLAVERGLWLHIDACLGGFLAPFAARAGYPVPEFDFALPGVTSLSADLHKYGYTAKGASVVLFRDAGLQEHQRFEFRDWPRGLYGTDTFLGTRPGGPIASAWAVMNYLGEQGYIQIAQTIMDTKARLIEGLRSIDGLEIVEPTDLCILLYRSRDLEVDINAVADGMGELGWFVGRSMEPPAVHLALNTVHAPIVDEYIDDLSRVVRQVRACRTVGIIDERTY